MIIKYECIIKYEFELLNIQKDASSTLLSEKLYKTENITISFLIFKKHWLSIDK